MSYKDIFEGSIIAIAIFIFAASFVIGYLIQAFSYKKLLTLARYSKPKRAFIPFSNGYFIGYLSTTVHPSMNDESIAARRRKRGISSLILTTLLPVTLFISTFLFLFSSPSTAYNDLETIFLVPLLIFIFIFFIISIIGLYFTISMYKKFCNTTLEAVAWALGPPALVFFVNITNDSFSTLVSIIVMSTVLVFAYTRKFYDPTK